MKKYLLFVLTMTLLLTACRNNTVDLPTQENWLIPVNLVLDGGPGKDGIASIDNPTFISIDKVAYLAEDDLVVGVVCEGIAKAYPHAIMDWHEIANDDLGDKSLALTYCPLTGTALAWNRVINGTKTTFGVSGSLYNTNLMPYDRATDSYWSQMKMQCVNGELIGSIPEQFQTIETTWSTWKAMFPNSQILSAEIGFGINYFEYPYGDYRTNDENIIFPLEIFDTRLPFKERVLGVINKGSNRAYRLSSFTQPALIYQDLGPDNLIIVGSKELNFVAAFYNQGLNDFTIDLDNLPVIASDSLGNQLSITGEIVAGPKSGIKLETPISYMGYWFAFGTFFEGIQIY